MKKHPLSIDLLESRIAPAIITVTSTGDNVAVDGFVTLREAIIATNTNAASGDAPAGDVGLDEIRFNIPGSGVQTISPATALPIIAEPLTIDGYTQPGAAANSSDTGTIATIVIEINAASAPLGANGLVSQADATTMRGLAITGFKQSTAGGSGGIGILLSGQGPGPGQSSGCHIEGNFIGVHPDGLGVGSNQGGGIVLLFSHNDFIGGNTPAARNVISGNGTVGILVQSSGNMIQGNVIGPNAFGATQLLNAFGGNFGDGIAVIVGAGNNKIGGTNTGEGNRIAFNNGNGVEIESGSRNTIEGNSIFQNLGLGIDLGNNDAVDPNDVGDADTGANSLQNFSILTAVPANQAAFVTVKFQTTPTTPLRIEIFSNAFRNNSGNGEGEHFMTGLDVTSDASGNVDTSTLLDAGPLGADRIITATATNTTTGDTSEFSNAAPITSLKILPSGRAATFNDLDGDLVTVKTTRGVLTPANFGLALNGLFTGEQLQLLALGDASFDGASITITAKRDVFGGDGFANVGFVDATGRNLSKLNIKGDLGRIAAGGIASLAVHSMGLFGTSTQAPFGNLASLFTGAVGAVKVKTDVAGATLASRLNFGAVKIGGDFIDSKLIALGNPLPLKPAQAQAIKSFKVIGSVERSQVLAGYDEVGQPMNPNVQIGAITVGGNWIASDLVAGATAGTDGMFGTSDDDKIGVGNAIVASIRKIVINGMAFGTPSLDNNTDHFGFVAQQIGSCKIGATVFPLKTLVGGEVFDIGATGEFLSDLQLREVSVQ